jgi:hypothetical protein
VIHVAFNRKAGMVPLTELLHSDRVLRTTQQCPSQHGCTIVTFVSDSNSSPDLNDASDSKDCGTSLIRLWSTVRDAMPANDPKLSGIAPSS